MTNVAHCPWVSMIARSMEHPAPLDTERLLTPLKEEAPALYQWYADHNRFTPGDTEHPGNP